MKRTRNGAEGTRSRATAAPQRATSTSGGKHADPAPQQKQVAGARRSPLPEWIAPTLCTLVDDPPSGDEWLHEIKLDGYRILARTEAGDVRLLSRSGKDWTRQFAPVAHAVAALGIERAILDGEVVMLRSDGTTSFQDLQNVLSRSDPSGIRYFVFDLLHLDEQDLTGVPLLERKRLLEQLLATSAASEVVRYTDHVVGSGPEFYRQACSHGLEGIISKRARSTHQQGRSREWLKLKCLQGQEFVIGGFTEGTGSRTGFGALLLGVHEDAGLRYCGRVGTGFSEASLRELSAQLRALERKQCPFLKRPVDIRTGVHWVEPELVAEVGFLGWTRDGLLRQPSFAGLRRDKAAADVVRERAAPPVERKPPPPAANTPSPRAANAPSRRAASPPSRPAPDETSSQRVPDETSSRRVSDEASSQRVPDENPSPRAAGNAPSPRMSKATPSQRAATRVAGIRITNPSKVLFPDPGLTKHELAQYYEMVAQWMVPHIERRPLTLVRCPDGYEGECFFQKNAENTPPQVGRVHIPDPKQVEDSTYLSIDHAAALVALLQMGVLEFHIWGSREQHLEQPDRIVFDLDPGPGVTYEEVLEGAFLVRDTLARLDLQSRVMLTGGKGLHVVLPVEPEHDWATVKDFSHALVQAIVRSHPSRYTGHLAKVRREKKIFLDYLRNGRGATAVAPYSTRARAGAPVAVPIDWEELTTSLRPDAFNVRNLAERLRRVGDPWLKKKVPPQWLGKTLTSARKAARG